MDGSVAIFGHSDSYDTSHRIYAAVLSNSLGLRWDEHFGSHTAHDGGEAVAVDSNGGTIFMGRSNSYGNGSEDVFLRVTSPGREVLREGHLEGVAGDTPAQVLISTDAYWVIGSTRSFGNGSEVMLARVPKD